MALDDAKLDMLGVLEEYAAFDEMLMSCKDAWPGGDLRAAYAEGGPGPAMPAYLYRLYCKIGERRDRALRKARTP